MESFHIQILNKHYFFFAENSLRNLKHISNPKVLLHHFIDFYSRNSVHKMQQDCNYTTIINYALTPSNGLAVFHTCLFHKCRRQKTSHKMQLSAEEWSQQNHQIESASNYQNSAQKWKLSNNTPNKRDLGEKTKTTAHLGKESKSKTRKKSISPVAIKL